MAKKLEPKRTSLVIPTEKLEPKRTSLVIPLTLSKTFSIRVDPTLKSRLDPVIEDVDKENLDKDHLDRSLSKLKSGKIETAKVNRGSTTKGQSNRYPPTGRSLDLCFLMDSTGSMGPSIEAAKQKVKVFMTRSYPGVNAIRIAFVAYRDFGDSNQFEILDFTSNVEEAVIFVDSLSASGGGDMPENVFGGMEKVIGLNWSANKSIKILIHILGIFKFRPH